LRHNVRVLRQISGEGNFFCPMVKASAYGHGDVEVTRVLIDEGVSCVGVARIEEGRRLREADLTDLSILVFDPFLDRLACHEILNLNLTPVLSSWESLKNFDQAAAGKKIGVHIKFNTGMSRLGFSINEAERLSDFFKSKTNLKLEGICSHLLNGEDLGTEDSRTQKQMEQFAQVLPHFSGLPVHIHIFNSSSLMALKSQKKSFNNWGARPGLSLYGVKPEILVSDRAAQENWAEIEIKPVMQVVSHVSHIQHISAGETVSYGGRFTAKEQTTLAVIPIGYADGYSRQFSNLGRMIFREKEKSIAGIVCMDFTMLDVTDLHLKSEVKLGEVVVVLGAQGKSTLSAERLAQEINTNAYEILTHFSARVPREYHD
jgi:alanine racemase